MAEPFHNSCHHFVLLEDREIHTENVQDKIVLEWVIRLYSLDRRNITADHEAFFNSLPSPLSLYACCKKHMSSIMTEMWRKNCWALNM